MRSLSAAKPVKSNMDATAARFATRFIKRALRLLTKIKFRAGRANAQVVAVAKRRAAAVELLSPTIKELLPPNGRKRGTLLVLVSLLSGNCFLLKFVRVTHFGICQSSLQQAKHLLHQRRRRFCHQFDRRFPRAF